MRVAESVSFSLTIAYSLAFATPAIAQNLPAKPTYEEAIRCASYLTQLSGSKKASAGQLTDPGEISAMKAKAQQDEQQAMTWLSYSSLFGGTRDQIVADYRADRAAFSAELDAARARGKSGATAYLYPIGEKCEAYEAVFGPNLSKLTG